MTRKDWPLGPALRAAREKTGLSVRKAAAKTNGLISSGRWYQLESGVQKVKGQEIPIGTTPETVFAAALAIDWDTRDAFDAAGMDHPPASVADEIAAQVLDNHFSHPPEEVPPDWLLYLTAVLEYVTRNHSTIPGSEVADILLECENLAARAVANRPDLRAGLDESIEYGERLNRQLVRLREVRAGGFDSLTPESLTPEMLADPESYGLAANRGEKGVPDESQ